MVLAHESNAGSEEKKMIFRKSAVAAMLLTGALVAAPVSAADQAAFDAAYATADAARKGAAKVGYEWRDTKKMLKSAKKLADKGKFDKAIALANKAKFQGERAQAQAAEQEKLWRTFVVR